ncbi:MAG: hypothetical protein R2770_14925 [Acidimicrobiales bacterium]
MAQPIALLHSLPSRFLLCLPILVQQVGEVESHGRKVACGLLVIRDTKYLVQSRREVDSTPHQRSRVIRNNQTLVERELVLGPHQRHTNIPCSVTAVVGVPGFFPIGPVARRYAQG